MMVIFRSETVILDKANPCLVFMTREMEEKRGEECNGFVHEDLSTVSQPSICNWRKSTIRGTLEGIKHLVNPLPPRDIIKFKQNA